MSGVDVLDGSAVMEHVPELDDAREASSGSGEKVKSAEKFSEVTRKRKRKLKSSEMETEGSVEGDGAAMEDDESPAKRPSFPPVDATTALVRPIH